MRPPKKIKPVSGFLAVNRKGQLVRRSITTNGESVITSADGRTGHVDISAVSDGGTPGSHASSHQNGGADELSLTGMSGLLATSQNPTTHAIGGAEHSSSTISGVNAKVSDGDFFSTNPGEFTSLSEATSVSDADYFLIENSAGAKRYVEFTNMPIGIGNVDGGRPDSVYLQIPYLDGGSP